MFSSQTGELKLEENSHFSVGQLIDDELPASLIILVGTSIMRLFNVNRRKLIDENCTGKHPARTRDQCGLYDEELFQWNCGGDQKNVSY